VVVRVEPSSFSALVVFRVEGHGRWQGRKSELKDRVDVFEYGLVEGILVPRMKGCVYCA